MTRFLHIQEFNPMFICSATIQQLHPLGGVQYLACLQQHFWVFPSECCSGSMHVR